MMWSCVLEVYALPLLVVVGNEENGGWVYSLLKGSEKSNISAEDPEFHQCEPMLMND